MYEIKLCDSQNTEIETANVAAEDKFINYLNLDAAAKYTRC